MRKLIILFLILLLFAPVVCFAGSVQDMHKAVIARKNAAGEQIVDYEQDFEGTGTPTNWTAPSGDSSYDQSTTGLNFGEGAQCHRSAAARTHTYDPSYNAASKYFSVAMKYAEDIENDEVFFLVYDNGGTGMVSVGMFGASDNMSLSCIGGTGQNTSDASFVVTNENHVKIYVTAATSAIADDGTATVWLWVAGAWVQKLSCTGIDADANIDKITLQNSAGEAAEILYFDSFRDNATDITGLPSGY